MLPRVAIIYLSYHCQPHLERALDAWKKIVYPKDRLALVVVDNPHPQFGSAADFLREKIMPLSGTEIPAAVILAQTENLGFCGGNNAGIKWALENNFDYIFLHNDDGWLTPDAIAKLVECMENDKKIGACQGLVLLAQSGRVNTAGNNFHYLGFGYCGRFNEERNKLPAEPYECGYCSGAALMLRADLLKKFGGLDQDYFLYHEDLEYSMRLKAAGYKIACHPGALFFHNYSFSRNEHKFYFMERNRFGLMLVYFKWRTLFLFMPMALVVELGLLLFSLKNGWIKSRLRCYKYWLLASSWRLWLAKRKKIQAEREVSDRQLLSRAVGKVEFNDIGYNGPIIKYIANPILNLYWQIVRGIIFW